MGQQEDADVSSPHDRGADHGRQGALQPFTFALQRWREGEAGSRIVLVNACACGRARKSKQAHTPTRIHTERETRTRARTQTQGERQGGRGRGRGRMARQRRSGKLAPGALRHRAPAEWAVGHRWGQQRCQPPRHCRPSPCPGQTGEARRRVQRAQKSAGSTMLKRLLEHALMPSKLHQSGVRRLHRRHISVKGGFSSHRTISISTKQDVGRHDSIADVCIVTAQRLHELLLYDPPPLGHEGLDNAWAHLCTGLLEPFVHE